MKISILLTLGNTLGLCLKNEIQLVLKQKRFAPYGCRSILNKAFNRNNSDSKICTLKKWFQNLNEMYSTFNNICCSIQLRNGVCFVPKRQCKASRALGEPPTRLQRDPNLGKFGKEHETRQKKTHG